TSFGIHFLLWQRSFQTIRKNVEPKLFVFLLALFTILVVLAITGIVYPNLPETIRHSVFQVVSAISGTGFQTTDFAGWPQSALFLLIILMIFGGMMDSTSGGVKQLRLYILFKAVAIEIAHFYLPIGSVRKYTIWKGNSRMQLDERVIKNTAVFFTLFFTHFFIGVSVFLFLGYDLTTACFELASALNNVGMSLGATNAQASPIYLWNQIIAMFFGRLEFVVIIFAVSKVIRDGIQVAKA
ncbi:MAG TPA: potassium transporter TrkG, partial [Thermotogota bacterium]|nr:potassium transporter TrkG [Thermotogota bacterium]